MDAEIAAYCNAGGYELAFRAKKVPTGGAVAYLDGGRGQPGLLELIPAPQVWMKSNQFLARERRLGRARFPCVLLAKVNLRCSCQAAR